MSAWRTPRLDLPSLGEGLLVCAGLATLGVLWSREVRPIAESTAFDLPALAAGSVERWTGLYAGSQKIGWSLGRRSPVDGGVLLQERSQLRLVLLGQPNDLSVLSDVEFASDGAPRRLLAQIRTEVQGVPVTLRAEGRAANGGGMDLDLFQAGTKLSSIHLDEFPATPTTIYTTVAAKKPKVGDRFDVPWFNPLALAPGRATVEVREGITCALPGEPQTRCWVLGLDTNGQKVRTVITEAGERVEEEEEGGGLGLRLVAESPEMARTHGWGPDDEAPDLIALSAVPIDRPLPGGGRSLRTLVLAVEGAEAVSGLIATHHGQRWDPSARRLRVERTEVPTEGKALLPIQDRAFAAWLRPTSSAPADHPKIRRTAGTIVGDNLRPADAARRLNAWVHENLDKVPVASFPNAVEVLESGRGDCNEHTTLYVALARAVGLPARIAAGIVYTEAIFADGAFYYHAWPEVFIEDRWVAIDPTFGQFPADATHVKLVEGDLDQQMNLMGVVGRLRLRWLEAE